MDRIVDSLINYQRLLVLIGGLLLVFGYAVRDIGQLEQVKQDIAAVELNIYTPITIDVQDRADAHYRREWAAAFGRSKVERSQADREMVLKAIARATIMVPSFDKEREVPLPPLPPIEMPAGVKLAAPKPPTGTWTATDTLPMPPAPLLGRNIEMLLPEGLPGAKIGLDLVDLSSNLADELADVLLANNAALARSGLMRIMLAATGPGDICTLIVDANASVTTSATRSIPCSTKPTRWTYRVGPFYKAPQRGAADRIASFFATNGTLRNKPLQEVQTEIDAQEADAKAESVDLGGVKFPRPLVTWPFLIVIVTSYMLMLAELHAAERLLTVAPVEAPGAKTIGWFAMFDGLAAVPMLAMFVGLPTGAAGYALWQLGFRYMVAAGVVLVFAGWFAREAIRIAGIVRAKAGKIGATLGAV